MRDEIQTSEDVSAAELRQAVATLAKFKPGFVPFPLFLQIARLGVLSIIEVVPCRRAADGSVEVLLVEREADDPLWPGMWHNPGTVMRPSDRTDGFFEDAFRRIFEREIGTSERPRPQFVADRFHQTRRGTESARIYCIELKEQPKHGSFFRIDELPANTIASHVPVIEAGAAYFASRQVATDDGGLPALAGFPSV